MNYAFQGFKKKFLDGLSIFNLKDATVLDIGCGRGECVNYLEQKAPVAKVYGIDPGLKDNPMYSGVTLTGDRFQLFPTSAECTGLPENKIDIAFSLVSFEHLPDIDRTLAEINRILKPGGIFVSFWYPIWSSRHGHHFMFWIPELTKLIDPWSHLYLSAEEMGCRLKKCLHPSSVRFVIRYIYESLYLNRLPYNRYIAAFRNMPLKQIHMKEIKTKPPSEKILKRLPSSLAQSCMVGGFDVVFQKVGGTKSYRNDSLDQFFEQVHSLEEKISPISLDDQRVIEITRTTSGRVLIFVRQEIFLKNPIRYFEDKQRWELVQGEIRPGQLVPNYDLAVILQNSNSNYAFTQAISHVIQANRILALDETGETLEIKQYGSL